MIPARAESFPLSAARAPAQPKPQKGLPISADLRSEILDLWSDGFDTAEIEAEVGRHEADVHRVIRDERAARRGNA